ncbi:PTS sugar transporter subunit IIA [bacterium]|nr:PTS sugar transporter subunit IIA [bacterium]
MKLSNLLNKNLVILDIEASKKEDVFREMIDVLCKQNKDFDRENLFKCVMERESQQSTYLGNSLSLPHARIDDLNDFVVICGRSKKGIHFEETKDTINFVIMLLTCKTKNVIMLQTMGAFATIFTQPALVKKLFDVKSVSEFIDVIDESNVVLKKTLTAKDIMDKDVFSINVNDTLKRAIDLFFIKNISGAPVLNNDSAVMGVLTEKDIIKTGLPQYMSMMDNISFLNEYEPFEEIFKKEDDILVKDIYCKDFVSVHENVSVIQLAFYFVNKNCRRILVLDDNKKLLGIILRKDLIRKVIHI